MNSGQFSEVLNLMRENNKLLRDTNKHLDAIYRELKAINGRLAPKPYSPGQPKKPATKKAVKGGS